MTDVTNDVADLAFLKIIRAVQHMGEIDARIADFAASKPYEIIRQPNGKETPRILRQPPVEIAIMAGELVYQVRSALDHLFFELVKRNQRGIVLPPKWEHDAQFPLNTRLPSGISAPVPMAKFASPARDWISDGAFAFIEGLQPYYRGKRPNDLLRLLTKLSNIDKHRHLNMTVLRLDFMETVTTPEGWASHFIQTNLDHGTEVSATSHEPDVTDRAVKVEREFTPRIAFNEPTIGPPEATTLYDVIYQLPTMVMSYILPTFKYLYSHP